MFPPLPVDAARAYAWTSADACVASSSKQRPISADRALGGARAYGSALLALDARLPGRDAGVGTTIKARGTGSGSLGPYAFRPSAWPSTEEILRPRWARTRRAPSTFAGAGSAARRC